MAKSAVPVIPQIEVGLVCDAGTSPTGLYGLTELFKYACEFASKRQMHNVQAPLRIGHWRQMEKSSQIDCIYDSSPGEPHALTALVLPGNEAATIGGNEESPLVPWLRFNHRQGVVLAAVCGGVFILARTGLLEGRQATTHWALAEQFARQFPRVLTETDRMVIDYGDVVTAGGVLAWADLGLRLTERFLGPTVMLETARYMNVDPPGREQRYYSDFNPPTKHGDAAILKAQQWLSTQRGNHISVADIAAFACLEARTFLRRFVKATGMKPSEYQQRLLITRAREMLEFSRTSVDEIAAHIGYGDVGGFRRVFRRIVGLTPSDYRRRFSRLVQQER
jgi:transcriptional regulator GlxA family with amidase domain